MSTAIAQHTLADLLNPRSVAVIGASEDQTKFGGRLFRMLLKHRFSGAVYPINPVRETLFDLKTYPSIAATPQAPDMVVMALPRDKIKGEIAACAARGVKAAIIITSKFSDAGAEGAALEADIVAVARAGGMRLIGPNCLGVISPANQLVLCSSPALEADQLIYAPIGFVSQSGALMATLFDRARDVGIGFSHCISIGNQADLELADFVEFLIDDDKTRVICSYVEGIKSPGRFVQLARRARAAGKPWLIVKAGATEDGSRAAFSHTASLAGDYASLEAVCRRENVILLNDAGAMLTLAAALARYPGRRVSTVAVITTSGGGGSIAADRLNEAGIGLARFSAATTQALDEYYSPGQAGNPIDIGGRKHDGAPELGLNTAVIALADENTDLALSVLTTAPDVAALTRELIDGGARSPKPSLFVMLPGRAADKGRALLVEAGVPFTDTLAEALEALRGWKRWSEYRAPGEAIRAADQVSLVATAPGTYDEFDAKALLGRAGIGVNRGVVVGADASPDEVLTRAAGVGYPLVVKVVSPDIVHKSDVGGVALDVRDGAALHAAIGTMRARIGAALPAARIDGFYLQAEEQGELELIIGARRDAQFGPQVLVGAGGVLVELLKDVAVLPAPLDLDSARAALLGLKVAPLLAGWRGRPALDVDAVADVIVRLGWLAVDLAGQDFEIDINPLKVRAAGQGAVAVDARIRVGVDIGAANA